MTKGQGKPRILLITRNFPPLTGGMERLMHKAAQGLDEWAELTIIGPTGSGKHSPPGVPVSEAPPSLISFMLWALWHVLRLCRHGKYDVVLGGSGLVAPLLWLASKLSKSPSAVFIHGLDIVVDNALYQRLFVPAVAAADQVIANSSNTRNLAISKGVAAERITVINPGTELPDLESLEARDSFCKRYAIPFDKIILFVGRMTRRKGLSAFIKHSLPSILEASPGAGLVVIGDNPDQGLTSHGEQEQVLKAVQQAKLEDHVRFLGAIADEDLLAGYAVADVQIFPLVDVPGDVEGFGMVAIEAAACGTPTVAFNTGGVADAISAANGALAPTNDYKQLSRLLLDVIDTGHPQPDSCISHAAAYAWPAYSAKLRSTLTSIGLRQ
ncbi:MAG: glycosyltransferase family 4 protein [Halioglobus sp.]